MARASFIVAFLATCDAFLAPHMPKTSIVRLPSIIGAWEKDYYSTVNVDPSQLEQAFATANGAAIDAKVAAAAEGTGLDTASAKAKLIESVGDLGILNSDVSLAKKLRGMLTPAETPEKK